MRRRARRPALRAAALCGAVASLAACATPPGVARYDLGLAPAHEAPLAQSPAGAVRIEVAAPAWLDGTGIVYRLAYEDASQVRSYAQSRWVEPPAALLAQRLRERDAGAPQAPGELQIELLEFSQVFESPTQSHALLRARASMRGGAERAPTAQRLFEVRRAARSADAPGAVHAMAEAVDAFAQELDDWLKLPK